MRTCKTSDWGYVYCNHEKARLNSNEVQGTYNDQTVSGRALKITDSSLESQSTPFRNISDFSQGKTVDMGSDYYVTQDLWLHKLSVKASAVVLEVGFVFPIGQLAQYITPDGASTLAVKLAVRLGPFKQNDFAATLTSTVVDISSCMTTSLTRQFLTTNVVGNEGLTLFDCLITGLSKQKLNPTDKLFEIKLKYDWLGVIPPCESKSDFSWTVRGIFHWIVSSLNYNQLPDGEEEEEEEDCTVQIAGFSGVRDKHDSCSSFEEL